MLGTVPWLAGNFLCQAQLISNTYSDLEISDRSVLVQPIGTAPDVAVVEQIRITLLHTWVGDLTVRIIAPSGSEFTLFDQPGLGLPELDSGYASNLGLDNFPEDEPTSPATYTFRQSGLSFDSAADLDATQEISDSEIYAAKTWPSGPFAAGTWHVSITDSAAGDDGFLRGAEVSFTPVPEPVSTAMATSLLLAAVVAWRQRTRNGRGA